MKELSLNKLLPHLIAVLLFIAISFIFYSPVLEGKMMRQSDMLAYAGASQEMKELKKETGEHALWTDRMFGGMPTFTISNPGKANLVHHLHNLLAPWQLRPASNIFLYFICFYIALLIFGINRWLSIAGAIAYGFSTYFIIILDVGHITKSMALAYMPVVIASIYDAFNGNRLRGSILLALSLSLQIYCNHIQITYYTLFVVIIMFLFYLYESFKEKTVKLLMKSVLYLSVAATFAALSNLTSLWTVAEYGKYSMRGKSNIVQDAANASKGLDKNYITEWSYDKTETLNLLIPNLKGGSNHTDIGKNSNTYKQVERHYGAQTALQFATNADTYWGEQRFTSGPVYIGASVIMLFMLGMFLLRGKLKWWILAATVLSILLAWGRNFMWFTDIFIDYVPGYNKFRTVSMILVIAQFTIPLLGIYVFDRIIKNNYTFEDIKKPLLYSVSTLSAIALFALLILPSFASFTGLNDERYPEIIQKSLYLDRVSMLRFDSFRTLIFIFLTAGIVWAVVKKKINSILGIVILGIVFLVDLIPVTKRYSHSDNWVSRTELYNRPYTPSKANSYIKSDTEHFRVLNLSSNTFNDAATSYFHNSIGGYQGAKMQRYQELIEWHIQPEMSKFIGNLQNARTYEELDIALQNNNVLNMLNTRYYIISPKENPLENPYAFGNAWLVEKIVYANDSEDEMITLGTVDLTNTAVLNKDFKNKINENFQTSPYNKVNLEKYSANRLKYSYNLENESFAIFNEIYYPAGWIATVNGVKQDIIRTNYLLRGLILPAGQGTIEFEFRPSSYYTGNVISNIFSAIILLVCVGSLVLVFVGNNKVLNKLF